MTNSIIQRAKNEALDFFNSFNVDKAFLGDKEITLNEMLNWWKDELTRVTGASNTLYYQAMIEATDLLIADQPKTVFVYTLIDLVGIVPRGTEMSAYTLLETLGTVDIINEHHTITLKRAINSNGITFTFTENDNTVKVYDINGSIVGKATHDDHITYIDVIDLDESTVNDLHDKDVREVAHYIASISFN